MPSPHPPSINYAEVVSRLEAGAFVSVIAREHGVSASTISSGAKRHGWRRSPGQRTAGFGRRPGNIKLDAAQRSEIAARALAGISRNALSREYGVSRKLVWIVLRDNAVAAQ